MRKNQSQLKPVRNELENQAASRVDGTGNHSDKGWSDLIRSFLTTAFIVVMITAAFPGAANDSHDVVSRIAAGTIATISDGDLVGQSYATGRMAPAEAGYRDTLTILSIVDGDVTVSRLPVSNSVTAAPEVLALTPDGRTALVTERLGERLAGGETVHDLPPGRRLFAFDLSDKSALKLGATVGSKHSPKHSPSAPTAGASPSSPTLRPQATCSSCPTRTVAF